MAVLQVMGVLMGCTVVNICYIYVYQVTTLYLHLKLIQLVCVNYISLKLDKKNHSLLEKW